MNVFTRDELFTLFLLLRSAQIRLEEQNKLMELPPHNELEPECRLTNLKKIKEYEILIQKINKMRET